jgi:ATP-binding cassette subfamily F protein uup
VESGKSVKNEKTRLSYKEQQEYNKLEPEIDALEKEKDALEAELSAGSPDYELLDKKSKRVAEIIELLDAKMERWMELGQYVQS